MIYVYFRVLLSDWYFEIVLFFFTVASIDFKLLFWGWYFEITEPYFTDDIYRFQTATMKMIFRNFYALYHHDIYAL
jgi:hypothetical protein